MFLRDKFRSIFLWFQLAARCNCLAYYSLLRKGQQFDWFRLSDCFHPKVWPKSGLFLFRTQIGLLRFVQLLDPSVQAFTRLAEKRLYFLMLLHELQSTVKLHYMLADSHLCWVLREFSCRLFSKITYGQYLLSLNDAVSLAESVMTMSKSVRLYLSSWSLKEKPLNSLHSSSSTIINPKF